MREFAAGNLEAMALLKLAVALGSIDEVRAVPVWGVAIEPSVIVQDDPLLIRGWALDPRTREPFAAIALILREGAFAGSTGISRRDVANAFGIGPDIAAGFVIVAPSAELAPGLHHGAVIGTAADGERFAVGDVRFVVRFAPPAQAVQAGQPTELVVVDVPERAGSGALLIVRGWALDERTLLPGSRVAITAGDATFGAAYGYPREDVVAAFGLPAAAAACGFRVDIPAMTGPSPLLIRAHLIAADGRVFSSDPRAIEAWQPLSPAVPLPALGTIDAVHVIDSGGETRDLLRIVHARLGDQVVLEGWAVGTNNMRADLIAVVDGVIRVPITTRSVRPDVAAGLQAAADCGFVAVIPLDAVEPGFHAVEVYARDGTTWLPTAARITLAVGA